MTPSPLLLQICSCYCRFGQNYFIHKYACLRLDIPPIFEKLANNHRRVVRSTVVIGVKIKQRIKN